MLTIRTDCKKLAPTWEKLASTFSADDNIIIAKIDAEAEDAKATAQEQGVSGYPTIKFFPAGSKDPEDYNGGRTEDALVEFINEKTGLSRVPGGGLNAKAGTIEALDSIIGKISTGATVASVTEEVVAAAKDLKEKYAAYYVKVLAKMASTQGYVEKELARLEKMIKKGGLAPAKSDDLISRANILRMFGQGPKASKKDEL
jgi:protein disulfide-isomerase A6